MKIIYSLFKKYGTQSDRNAYTLFGFEIEHFPNINKYEVNY